MCLSICAGIIISIHTPTRGVTYNRYIEQEGAEDFNPHSHKGSDNSFHAEFSAKLHFNPHSHKGSDLLAHIGNIAGKKISIHTPTRGVTKVDQAPQQPTYYFNPHSHKGSDKEMRFWTREIENFNPHSHKGSDNHITTNDNRRVDFNPHSHKGSDLMQRLFCMCNRYFNPHSHKGSDR